MKNYKIPLCRYCFELGFRSFFVEIKLIVNDDIKKIKITKTI